MIFIWSLGISINSPVVGDEIYGKNKIETQNKSILTKTTGDHRICMSSVIFSLATGISAKIKNFETVNTSFPGFISVIKNLGGKIVIK